MRGRTQDSCSAHPRSFSWSSSLYMSLYSPRVESCPAIYVCPRRARSISLACTKEHRERRKRGPTRGENTPFEASWGERSGGRSTVCGDPRRAFRSSGSNEYFVHSSCEAPCPRTISQPKRALLWGHRQAAKQPYHLHLPTPSPCHFAYMHPMVRMHSHWGHTWTRCTRVTLSSESRYFFWLAHVEMTREDARRCSGGRCRMAREGE